MKRFYKEVTCTASDEGVWHILLDGKPVRTPLRHILAPAREGLAVAIADEWRAQGDVIRPDTMPLTQLQTTLQDKHDAERAAWCRDLHAFLETDLLCYVTGDVPDVAAEQARVWTPLRDGFSNWLPCPPLPVTTGLSVSAWPSAAWIALDKRLVASTPETLLIWRTVAGLTGSCVLGAALAHGQMTADAVFQAAQLEELYYSAKANEAQYGPDPHQAKLQATLLQEMAGCASFIALAST